MNSWRDAAGRQQPLPDQADVPCRLRSANTNAQPPILLIDIDGFDEQGERDKQPLRDLLTLCSPFREGIRPDVGVILTTRSTATTQRRALRNLIADLFTVEVSSQLEDRFGIVTVDDFTIEEIAVVIQHAAPEVRVRLGLAVGPPSSADSLGDDGAPARTPASQEVLGSLRHPVVWNVFTQLTEAEQHLVLDGTAEGIDRLTDILLERFCLKVNRRRSTLPGERARKTLLQLTSRLPSGQFRLRRVDHWVQGALGPLTQNEAASLYDEAISHGYSLGGRTRHPDLASSVPRASLPRLEGHP